MERGSGGRKEQDNSAASSKEEENTLATGVDRREAAWSLVPDGVLVASELPTPSCLLRILTGFEEL